MLSVPITDITKPALYIQNGFSTSIIKAEIDKLVIESDFVWKIFDK